MKTVTLELQIQVPDEAQWVACDESGDLFAYTQKPERFEEIPAWYSDEHFSNAHITNWKETLRRVE